MYQVTYTTPFSTMLLCDGEHSFPSLLSYIGVKVCRFPDISNITIRLSR